MFKLVWLCNEDSWWVLFDVVIWWVYVIGILNFCGKKLWVIEWMYCLCLEIYFLDCYFVLES